MYSSHTTIGCIQISNDNKRSPILAPDLQQCVQRGSNFEYNYNSNDEAKNAYQYAMNTKKKDNKQRKYLLGSRYHNIFYDNANIIDVREYQGGVNLKINLHDGEETVLKIRDVSEERETINIIEDYIRTSNKKSQARCHSGDRGLMFAYGYHNSKYGDYISMRDTHNNTREYCIEMRRMLETYFHDEIINIIAADRRQGRIPSINMGGRHGISSYCLISKDLINSAHFDLDTSVGISVFMEEQENVAKEWYFILPNTTVIGSERAIIIKLFKGCAISWDGRDIFHCTGLKEVGENIHVYGCFFGGKKFT